VATPAAAPADRRVSTLLELGLEGVESVHELGGSDRLANGTHRAWSVRPAMGTLVSVLALDASGARADAGVEAAFVEMKRLVWIFDRHDAGSVLSQLNAAGRLRGAPPELLAVVDRAISWHRATLGAFDVTVQPLVDLYRAARGVPTPAERAEAAELVGMDKLRRTGERIFFDRSGMGLTLDGIAKGYVVDGMAAALLNRGIRRFLINAGGDIRASGGREDGVPWTIGVRDPSDPDRLHDVLSVNEGAVATSGSYEKTFQHLIDAGSGEPSLRSRSVTVVSGTAMDADALATSLYVLGPAEGRRLGGSLPGCE
jgi:thiamine biosynthesis lipoprotein